MKNWQKGRTRPNPDPTLKAATHTKTEQFKQIAREAKEAKWKGFCEELSAETTLTQFWQFSQQMEGNDRTKTIPDFEDTNEDQRRERSSLITWAIPTIEQLKQPSDPEDTRKAGKESCRGAAYCTTLAHSSVVSTDAEIANTNTNPFASGKELFCWTTRTKLILYTDGFNF